MFSPTIDCIAFSPVNETPLMTRYRHLPLRIREDPHGAIRCTRPIAKPCSFGMNELGRLENLKKPSANWVMFVGMFWREKNRVENSPMLWWFFGAIKSIDGLFGWGGGEEKSDISTIGRRVRDFLINLYFTT